MVDAHESRRVRAKPLSTLVQRHFNLRHAHVNSREKVEKSINFFILEYREFSVRWDARLCAEVARNPFTRSFAVDTTISPHGESWRDIQNSNTTIRSTNVKWWTRCNTCLISTNQTGLVFRTAWSLGIMRPASRAMNCKKSLIHRFQSLMLALKLNRV